MRAPYKLTRRAALASLVAPAFARAESGYPAKPIQFVVPFTPGGGADTLARIVSATVSTQFGQQVVIENRAGAGGNIAAQVVSRAKPDGYTLLEGNLAHAIAMTMYRKRTYDIVKDFTPIILLGSVPFVLCTGPASDFRTTGDLIAAAKAKPDTLNYASSGIGGPSHLAMALFREMTGIQVTHVPYKGAAPGLEDLMAGRIQITFTTLPTAAPLVRSGAIRALGMASLSRAEILPEVPTIAESGVPGYEAATWFGAMAPTGTPPEIVRTLHDAFAAALTDPANRARLISEGFEIGGGTPEAFGAYIEAETRKWAPVVIASGSVVD